jgi:tetratricopeptide (TPR) repeat protein
MLRTTWEVRRCELKSFLDCDPDRKIIANESSTHAERAVPCSWLVQRQRLLMRVGIAFVVGATSLCAFGTLLQWQSPGLLLGAGNGIANWLTTAESGSGVEKALYRLMSLPGGEALYRRSPRETRPELTALLSAGENRAPLYSLRAMEDEQALDFDAAERDWKTWAERADDKPAAHLDLADFYDRRLKPHEELAALEVVGEAPANARERWTASDSERSWKAWERSLTVIDRFALPRTLAEQTYAGWEHRYPNQKAVYERELSFELAGKNFPAISDLIARYRKVFPRDDLFPVRAEAQLEAGRGSPQDGLAVFDRNFQPLWPAELVKSYYDLLVSGHQTLRTRDALRARLEAHPEGGADALKDAAKLFYIFQEQGQLDAAKAVLASFRTRKDSRGAAWSAEELYTLGRLLEQVQDFPEAARYYYALASDKKTPGAEQKGLAGLTRILLTAPEQPLRLGAGNLAFYKSIATMDRGPGYLNGILSLFLNSQSPASEYSSQDQLAVPYFHRAKAAELLAEIDKRFPTSPDRPELHARLMDAYAAYGENDAVIREGTAFLAQFPVDSRRVEVALAVGDVYSRTNQTEKEFALYRDLLKELSVKADGVPLGVPGAEFSKPINVEPVTISPVVNQPTDANAEADTDQDDDANASPSPKVQPAGTARSADYARVLDRYLSRLVAMQKLPDALALLRGELDRNPQDPGLYEKLAEFLEQNRLNAHEEEVYQRAIEQFEDKGLGMGWYGKLARFYLRQRRNADYAALSKKVIATFSGTELEEYLREAPAPDRTLALEVDLYALARFPHDRKFVRNLLAQYEQRHQQSEIEKLLWEHWAESPDFRDQLFELLSRSGRLDAQLDALKQQSPEIDKSDWIALAQSNPAAERFWMESCLWQSRFEQATGAADALAAEYPADAELGQTASSLYRSLAYFHPEDTDKAVVIEKRQLEARPDDLETLARIGDIYADRGRMAEASPYWIRMAEVRPGDANGYLQSATVFWDYFDFSSSLAQLRKGRERLADPTAFGYQAGAIEESRGDVEAALRDYVASALADKPSEESRNRLISLARRPATRAAVEAETAALLKSTAPATAAINLRVSVLDAQHRKADTVQEMNQSATQTESFDVLDALGAAARAQGLPEVEQLVLRRQIALTSDPVHNLELHYQLVDLLQQHNPAGAAAEVDAVYREHAKILGVVRATVDFDWAHGRKPQAVTVLLDSADGSYPDLKQQFQLEAARKLTDIGDYPRSRALLDSLLSRKPLDAAVEAALADNYAHSGDQAGLEAFYRTELAAVRSSNIESGEKTRRLAQLRRGMIGAATLLGNWSDAVDQYIELINSYPGDAALAEEAALAAGAHGQRDKLTNFYRTTVEASPRDARWSIVLARLDTALEDYPAAIDAYGKAIRVRPEQKDLYEAKASLEERLHKLDDAVADYEQLYKLSYRDPQWMEKEAEARARQGRKGDVVKALTEAWITGRPIKAANYFAVASRLEQWGLLDEARKFAEQGVDAAGADLLVDAADQSGAVTYARIMARLRQSGAAFTRLAIARQHAENVPLTAVAQQVVKEGPAAVTDEDWRKQRIAQRTSQAKAGFAQALRAIAAVAGEYDTPEEKAQFESWLQTRQSTAADGSELREVYLPAIQAAGLEDMEAALLWDSVEKSDNPTRELNEWLQLERKRGRLEEAATKIESLAVPATQKATILGELADVYRTVGDTPAELRTLDKLAAMRSSYEDPRYYHLLLASRPQSLIQRASNPSVLKESRDVAAQFLVANAKHDLALTGIAARSSGLPPVWKKAYTGLTGLYLRQHTSEVRKSLDGALGGDATIGERVAHPADRNEQLAGEVWFYYGSRYGEYLDEEKDSLAESYLQSELEHTPESAGAYRDLADYSALAGRIDAALKDYGHSLDLNSDQPAVLNSIAVLEWKQGRHAEALASWQLAVKRLADEMDARRVPESFWGDFALVLGDAAANGQYAAISQQVDAMLRVYLARNGDYRVESLLEAGYHAHGDNADWLLDIASAASDPESILVSIRGGDWIVKSQLTQILSRIVELDRRKAEAKPENESWEIDYAESNLVDALLNDKKYAAARAELAHISEEKRKSSQWLGAELRLEEADRTLAASVVQWKKHPETAPDSKDLRFAARLLDEPSKRIVLRFVYEHALEERQLTAPNFLGLASIDLDEGDVSGAVTLLKRLSMISGNPYPDMDSAASLLETRDRPSDAIQFLQPLVDAFPWEASYKVRLAKATLAANAHSQQAVAMLAGVASDPKAKYADRLAASKALHGQNATGTATGSGELAILVRGECPTADQATKPFFVDARIAAAACAPDDKTRESILASAMAIAPDSDTVRIAYVWAAFEAGQGSRALVAYDAILSSNAASYDPGQSQSDDLSDSPDTSDEQNADSAPARSTGSAIKPDEAAKLAWYAIHAREKRQEPDEALKLLESAMAKEHDHARHRAFEEEKKRLETEAARQEENEARAPKVHVELDQDRVVRPRLLQGMAFVPSRKSNSEGDVQ